MKAYYSYWAKGYRSKVDQFYLDMNKLSAHFAKKNYGEIHLITDSESVDSFKDIANWNSISTELDSLPEKYSHVWSLGKLLTFKIAAERGHHFIHIDADVIVWEKLPNFIDKADIFCQSREGHVSEWPSINCLYQLKNKYNINIIKEYNKVLIYLFILIIKYILSYNFKVLLTEIDLFIKSFLNKLVETGL